MKLPIKRSNTGYVLDENCNPQLFTESQAKTFVKKYVASQNKNYKRLGIKYRAKFLGLKNCGTHWNYTVS